MILDDRKRMILETIIRDYVETAEPVGSRAIVKKHALKISPATVRNEMADLEDMGYLEQPHTSAGRIPSQQGFRYFVDCMMENESLDDKEADLLQKVFKDNIHEWNEVIGKVGHFLAQITKNASFVIVPALDLSEFKYLQIVPIEKGKALLILVSDLGVIMHRKIDISENISDQDLKSIGGLFNQAFHNRRLGDIKRSDLQMLRDDLQRRHQVIGRVLEAIDILLGSTGEERIIISGALNMLNEPEFKDMDRLKKILTILDDDSIKDLIPEDIGDEISITIGKENKVEDIKDMSLVFAGYKGLGDLGRVGLMGPVRMEYWKAAGAIEAVRKIIEEVIKDRLK